MQRSARRPVRKRKNNNIKISSGGKLVIAAIIIIAIALLIYYIRSASIIGFGEEKYYNVTVNGISLKGYTRQQADNMFNNLLSDWKNRVYSLTYNNRVWNFSADTFSASLDVQTQLDLAWNMGHYGSRSQKIEQIQELDNSPAAFVTNLKYDEAAMDEYIQNIYNEVYVAPVDANVVVDVTEPRIVTESQTGLALNKEKTKEMIINMLKTGQQEQALPVEVLEPAVSSDSVSGGIQVISEYSTDMSESSLDRYKNVKLALSFFNGFAVYPGDRVSFNDVVGERTEARGFLEALEYAGSSVVNGVGGGCCQASTTLYCAVTMAGMTIIERHPHNMTVSYAEPSMDATVNYGEKDFIFQNDTDHTIYIYTDVTREAASVRVFGARPEYKITLKSYVVEVGLKATKRINREDVTAQYVYYTDEEYLYSEGKEGCRSQSWLIYTDWDTGEEVKRVQVTSDVYMPGTSIYYVGVHDRSEPLLNGSPQ